MRQETRLLPTTDSVVVIRGGGPGRRSGACGRRTSSGDGRQRRVLTLSAGGSAAEVLGSAPAHGTCPIRHARVSPLEQSRHLGHGAVQPPFLVEQEGRR